MSEFIKVFIEGGLPLKVGQQRRIGVTLTQNPDSNAEAKLLLHLVGQSLVILIKTGGLKVTLLPGKPVTFFFDIELVSCGAETLTLRTWVNHNFLTPAGNYKLPLEVSGDTKFRLEQYT